MTLYFFDIHHPLESCQDEIGIYSENRKAVRTAAIEALPDMASDLVLGDDQSL